MMPYVLFWSEYKVGGRVIENTTEHYTIHKDEAPVLAMAQKMIEDNEDLASWGVAWIEAASEPQWEDNALL